MLEKIPQELRDAVPAALGSALAMRWISGPWWWRAIALCAAAYVAWLSGYPIAEVLELSTRWIGVVGFFVGLLTVSFASKVLETVQAIQPAQIWGAIIEAIRKKLGL